MKLFNKRFIFENSKLHLLNIYVNKKATKVNPEIIGSESTVELTDEQIYVVSFLFAVPLIRNLIKCRKYFLWKYIVNNLIILVQLFLLIGPLLDGCSYIKTIFEGRNIVLAFYFISFLAFIFFVNYFFEFPKRNFKTKK